MSEPDKKENLTFALSEEWRAGFCRAAIERIFNAATIDDSGSSKSALENIPGERQWPPDIGPKIGDEMEDGTIYAGISPDTGKPMYTTPRDAPTRFTFKKAAEYAKELDAHGHKDWRVPSKNELNVLYQNRNKGKLKGTFNDSGRGRGGWYWSSQTYYYCDAWDQRFSDGGQYLAIRIYNSSLRCVR